MPGQFLSVKIAQIEHDMRIYPRQRTQPLRIAELGRALDAGRKLPPIAVCHIRGSNRLYLVDGAHRIELYIGRGLNMVDVEDLGLLSLRYAWRESIERNTVGPLPLTPSDLKLAAQKGLDLGISESEVHAITHLDKIIIRSLENITFTQEDEKKILPRAFIERDKAGRLSTILDPKDIEEHKTMLASMPRNWSANTALKYLNYMLEQPWTKVLDDPRFASRLRRLYENLQTLFEKTVTVQS